MATQYIACPACDEPVEVGAAFCRECNEPMTWPDTTVRQWRDWLVAPVEVYMIGERA